MRIEKPEIYAKLKLGFVNDATEASFPLGPFINIPKKHTKNSRDNNMKDRTKEGVLNDAQEDLLFPDDDDGVNYNNEQTFLQEAENKEKFDYLEEIIGQQGRIIESLERKINMYYSLINGYFTLMKVGGEAFSHPFCRLKRGMKSIYFYINH